MPPLRRKLDAPLMAFAAQPESALHFSGASEIRGRSQALGVERCAPVLIRFADGFDEAATLAALRAAGVRVDSG